MPGSVRGFELASKKYGRKKWAEVLAPAIELAAKGFPVSYGLAQSLRGSGRSLEQFPESKRIFLKQGAFYEAGESSSFSRSLRQRSSASPAGARASSTKAKRRGGWPAQWPKTAA